MGSSTGGLTRPFQGCRLDAVKDSALTHKAKGGKTGRKIGRNYRFGGTIHSSTKYRLRHGIAPDAKRKEKA